jgi:hypothetical protein
MINVLDVQKDKHLHSDNTEVTIVVNLYNVKVNKPGTIVEVTGGGIRRGKKESLFMSISPRYIRTQNKDLRTKKADIQEINKNILGDHIDKFQVNINLPEYIEEETLVDEEGTLQYKAMLVTGVLSARKDIDGNLVTTSYNGKTSLMCNFELHKIEFSKIAYRIGDVCISNLIAEEAAKIDLSVSPTDEFKSLLTMHTSKQQAKSNITAIPVKENLMRGYALEEIA